jgi:hypothetical protein
MLLNVLKFRTGPTQDLDSNSVAADFRGPPQECFTRLAQIAVESRPDYYPRSRLATCDIAEFTREHLRDPT